MNDLIERTLCTLSAELRGRVSRPGQDGYAAATAIWPKAVGVRPRAVVHCRIADDVQRAVRAAREAALPLSVRGGGHDWACRSLCDGLVIDLSLMKAVTVNPEERVARIAGGARAADVADAADPFGLAAVTGSTGHVGMAGLTLGGGYGPLIGRFGLALDNLLAAEVVLADGRLVVASLDNEPELFWALRGGGGNFGVVTAMRHRLHPLPRVCSGALIYAPSDAKAVLAGCVDIAAAAPDALTFQLALVVEGGLPLLMVVPTWCGAPEESEEQVAPFLRIANVLSDTVDLMSCRTALTIFDANIVSGRRTYMETCNLPALTRATIDVFTDAIEHAASSGCAIFTHEFKGTAACVREEATAFGMRRRHVLVEILAVCAERSNPLEEQAHQQWARATLRAFGPMALSGAYANLLGSADDRASMSYGNNGPRLVDAKSRYDPDNVFHSAIPLPLPREERARTGVL